MNIEDYIKQKKAFLFGFDDVLYPEKDYLLQVYYLFSEFITYSELMDAAEIIKFMKSEFEQNGATAIFENTAAKFKISTKYEDNFKLLHQNARLPLKLLLYQQMLTLLQELVVERKEIYLVLDGNPAQQLNKVKQTEWHGLEKYLKLYFVEEFGAIENCIKFITHNHNLQKQEMLFIGNQEIINTNDKAIDIDYFPVKKLL